MGDASAIRSRRVARPKAVGRGKCYALMRGAGPLRRC